jgi:chaperonin GroES
MMQITPMRGKALVKILKEEKVTKSGILLPDTVEKEELERGEVVAVGQPKMDHGHELPAQVKVGDIVILKKYGPDKVKIEGEDYCIAEDDDMIGIQK